MHSLQTVCVFDTLEVLGGFEDESTRIINPDPNGMSPRRNGLLDPVGSFDGIHNFGVINQFGILLNGNKVWMGPFFV